jgi:hypothetical protein
MNLFPLTELCQNQNPTPTNTSKVWSLPSSQLQLVLPKLQLATWLFLKITMDFAATGPCSFYSHSRKAVLPFSHDQVLCFSRSVLNSTSAGKLSLTASLCCHFLSQTLIDNRPFSLFLLLLSCLLGDFPMRNELAENRNVHLVCCLFPSAWQTAYM